MNANDKVVKDIKPEDGKSQPKPEMPAEMAKWLVSKLDCGIPLKGHDERNRFATVVNRLVDIGNWEE